MILGNEWILARSDNPVDNYRQQPDFLTWMHNFSPKILHDIYQKYLNDQHAATRRDNTDPPMPSAKDGVRGSPPLPEQNTLVTSGITLRHSVFLLILNLITIEFLFDIFYFILKVLPIPLKLSLSFQTQLWPIYFGIFGVLLIFKIILMVFAALQWVTSNYEIRKNEIRYKYGVFSHNEKIFMCTHTQEVRYTQNLLGRIFNFGSIEIYSPVIKERVYLASIPNPKRYVEVIKANIPDSNQTNYFTLDQQIIGNGK
jgi:membrane protein YdbS with pleckstrin-like domain